MLLFLSQGYASDSFVAVGGAVSPTFSFVDSGIAKTVYSASMPPFISMPMDKQPLSSIWNPLGVARLAGTSASSYASIVAGGFHLAQLVSVLGSSTNNVGQLFVDYGITTTAIVLPTTNAFYFYSYSDFDLGVRFHLGSLQLLFQAGPTVFLDPPTFLGTLSIADLFTVGFHEGFRFGYDLGNSSVGFVPFVEIRGTNIADQKKPLALVSFGADLQFGK